MKQAQAFQFKIVLNHIFPSIWRRIIVPGDYTFWALHVAIQDAMGWHDCHLHEFRIADPRIESQLSIGIPDEDIVDDPQFLASWEITIAEYLSPTNSETIYIYDFGDWWEHTVTFEKMINSQSSIEYPVCVAGERSCPPEDSGGPHGYQLFIEAMEDPNHEAHQQYREWIGVEFDAEKFDPAGVEFNDPVARWNLAFGDN
jgi:hypothetical protein